MERITYFVDVLLPLHIKSTYTYRVPDEYAGQIVVGARVVVQFGGKRLYSALVRRVHTQAPSFRTKYVLSVIDTEPIVLENHFAFWEWISSYYMTYIGDVVNVALPNSLRLASESVVALHPEFTGELSSLTKQQRIVVDLLAEHGVMKVSDIEAALQIQNAMHLLGNMIAQQIVVMDEDIKQRFTPRKSDWLHLSPQYSTPEAQKQLFDHLEGEKGKAKQLAVMLRFMQLSHFGQDAVPKSKLTEDKELSPSSITTLIKNEVLSVESRTESRLEQYEDSDLADPYAISFSDEQQAALEYLSSSEKNVNLLYGVTSSGKTEVYIRLMADTIRQGKQVLFLLPEIALTAQIINRIRRFFGNKVAVYHSRFTPSQRAEIWLRTVSNDPSQRIPIIIGTRSALFLPFANLGLVIVDEEHDPSYKQAEPAPRYQGRDSAIFLAHQCGARVVLGSATPSIESYWNASNGKYGLVSMTHRFGGLKLPEVLCADMKDATKKKEVRGYYSTFLIEHIQQALNAGEQVILFQNRRGFSLRLECADCGWTPQCNNCDVSLVYHKDSHQLRCHYCGHTAPMPAECPACHSTHLVAKGFGTERVEDDFAILFPKATVARMDLDSTQNKNQYLEIINDFDQRRIDILVGTQMITKGLDFDNVSVVGILSADSLIFFPEFRAYERAYQLMTQVSGRAGRHGHQGKVIIQSYNPWHQAIRNVIDNDYMAMYNSQIQERRVFRYPPYYRLIDITLRHKEQQTLLDATRLIAQHLRATFGTRMLGPETPSIGRIRGYYIQKIMLRFERTEAIAQAKDTILQLIEPVLFQKEYAQLRVAFDVDPQ